MGGQALDQLSILLSPGLEFGRMGPCCWLLPWWADEGLAIGRSRTSQKLPCAWSCCWPRVCISSLPPQPFSLYFYKYIYIEIYMMQSAIETRPRIGREVLVSPSPLRL